MSDERDNETTTSNENAPQNAQQALDDLTVLSNIGDQSMGEARLNAVRPTDLSEGALGTLATIHQGSGKGPDIQQGLTVQTGEILSAEVAVESADAMPVTPIGTAAPITTLASEPQADPDTAPKLTGQSDLYGGNIIFGSPIPVEVTTNTDGFTAAATGTESAESVTDTPIVPAATEEPLHIDQMPVFGGVEMVVFEGAPEPGGPYDMQGKEGDDLRFRVNAFDPDGGEVKIDFSTPAHGVITYDSATGAYVYHPTDENWWGEDSVTVYVRDDEGNVVSQQVTIKLDNVDDETVSTITGGVGAESTTTDATQVTGTITATDIDGAIVSYEVVNDGQAHHGTLTVDEFGNFTFSAADYNWNGDDSFTVRVTDELGGTTDITVPITVTATDDRAEITSPTQVDATVGQDGVVRGDLNATDPDGDALTYGVVDPVTGNLVQTLETTYGTVVVDPATGEYTFTPNGNAKTLDDGDIGNDQFQVAVSDGHTVSTPQTVDVTIKGANDAPVVTTAATNLATGEDGKATGTIAATDVDAHDTVTYTLVGPNGEHVTQLTTEYGTVEINATTGEYTFTPKDGLQALDDGDKVTDGFKVAAFDGTDYSDPKAVSVTISGSNDAPVVTTAATDLATGEDGKATGTIAATDVDARDTVSYTLVGPNGEHVTELTTQYGTVEINPTTGQYTFTPKDGLQGLDDGESVRDGFKVAAFDGTEYSTPKDVAVTISGSNDAPVVNVSDLATGEDTTVGGTATFTDVDVEQSKFYLLNDAGERVTELTTDHGTVRIDSTSGQYTFTPGDAADALKAGQIAHDDFKVVAFDGTDQSEPKLVDVTITGSNDAPVVSVSDLRTDEDSAVGGTAAFTDVDGSSASYYLLNDAGQRVTELTTEHGTVAIDSSTGRYTFTPNDAADRLNTGDTAHDSFRVVAFDGIDQSAAKTVDVAITGTDDAPVVNVSDLATGEDASVAATAAFTDVDNSTASFYLLNDAGQRVTELTTDYGTVSINSSTGRYTFTPGDAADVLKAGQTAHDDFKVVAFDGQKESAAQTVDVTITGSNDAPVVSVSDLRTDEDSAVGGTAAFTDVDGSSASYYLLNDAGQRVTELTTEHGTVAIDSSTGRYTFTPNDAADRLNTGDTAHDSFRVVAFDGIDQSAAKTVDVAITGTDDATVITGTVDLGAMDEDGGSVTFTQAQLLANASDGDNTLHVANVSVDGGTLVDNHNGTWTFTPSADFSGEIKVSYDVVTDDGVATRTSADLDVRAVADEPDLTASATVTADSGNVTLDVDAAVGAGTVHYTTTGDTTIGNDANTLVMRVAQLTGGNKHEAASFDVAVVDAQGHTTIIGHGQANGSTWQNVTISLDNGFSGFEAGQTLKIIGEKGTNVSIDKLVVNGVEIQAETGTKERGANFHTGSGSDGGYASLHNGAVSFGLHGDHSEMTPVSETHPLTITVSGQESALGDVTLSGLPADSTIVYQSADGQPATLTVGHDGTVHLEPAEALRIAAVGATLTTQPGVAVGTVTTTFDMIGTDGTDHLYGGGGNDHILGGTGDDVIQGDAAVDHVDVALNIAATDHDTSETITYTIAGVPAGLTLANGDGVLVPNDDGTYSLTADELHDLHIEVPAGSPDAKFDLTVTATSHDGDDTASTTTPLHVDASYSGSGAAGNDTLEGGAGNDTLLGSGGNDTLVGGAGADLIEGGAGNDTIVLTGEDGAWSSSFVAKNVGDPTAAGTNETVAITGDKVTADVIHGGAGTDTLVGSSGNDAIFLDDGYSAAPVAGARLDSVEIINAGDGNDVVDLTSDKYTYGDTTIDGGAGNDVAWGNAGNDLLIGGTGNDNLFGSAGNDTLLGGAGADTLNGGVGADVLDAGADNDLVIAKGSEMAGDVMDGGAGTDTLAIQLTSAQYTDAVRAELLEFKQFMAEHPGKTFTFDTLGGATATNFEAVKVTVNGSDISLNSPPAVTEVTGGTNTESTTSTATTVTGQIAASDADSDTLSYSVVGDNATHNGILTVDSAGNFTFTAKDASWDGTDRFTVRVSDGHGGSVDVPVTITVTPMADTPVVSVTAGALEESVISVTNLGGSAGYHNTYGYYVLDDQGNPTTGQILFADAQGNINQTATIEGVDPSRIGYFIVPDGASNNSGLTAGEAVSFSKDGSGNWRVVDSDGRALAGDGMNVIFSNSALNSDGLTHMADNSGAGNQNWEDLAGGGDRDFNDVNLQTSQSTTNSFASPYDNDASGSSDSTSVTAGSGGGRTYGGAGNDVVNGNCGDDTLYGGSGADTVHVGGGDTAYGGSGNDVITVDQSGYGGATLVGNAGNDTITGGGSADVIYGDDPATASSSGGGYAYASLNIVGNGTESAETLTYVVGGLPAGVSLVDANGNALTANANGTYSLTSGQLAGLELKIPADGSVTSLDLAVTALSREGTTTASATSSTHLDLSALVGDGADTLSGGGGADKLYGGGGNDTFIYSADDVSGDYDADYQDQGGTARDGTDVTVDSDGYNATNDTYFGGAGHDTLVMGTGDDAIHISNLNSVEVINAGAGDDIVDLNYSDGTTYGAVTVDGGSGNDYIFANDGADTLYGGTGNDFISGDAGNDKLYGGDGTDTLYGGSGDDLLNGGAGADKLYGGSGSDTVDYSTSTSGVNVYLGAGDGNGYGGAAGVGVGGDAQGDTYSSIENVTGSAHDDYVYGTTGGTVANLGDGNDTFDNSEVSTAVGQDTVDGGAGVDTIWTGNGDDVLKGGSGNDALFGEAGNDTLIGGTGNDVMNGGDGSDTFLFDFGDGHDTVTGGAGNWTDTLDLTSLGSGVTIDISITGGNSWTVTTDNSEHLTSLQGDKDGSVVIHHADGSSDQVDFHSLEQIKW